MPKTIQPPPRISESVTTDKGTPTRAWHQYFDSIIRGGFSGKIDRVASAISGRLATITSDGNIQDSGKTAPTGSIVGTTDAQTLSGKTLDKPAISDFTNAGHNHHDAAGGGQLDESSLLLSDLTTNDATKDAHGFLPKLPDDAGKYLNGKGLWVGGGGTFTFGAAASKVVSDTATTAGSFIAIFPTNVAAANLVKAHGLYESARTGGVSFTIATADGAAAAGTETFQYVRIG